jgi:NTE family protein
MQTFELIIVGGGLTAARAIREYRAAGGDGRIALLTRETRLPYHRPPLSKRYLRGETEAEATLVEPKEFYEQNDVELVLGTEVTAVDPRERIVCGYRFGKLLIATGSIPRALDVPGAQLPGVFSLRTLDDSTAIREAARKTRDAVVVGSGFIGMEVAASLTELGLDVSLLSRDADLFAQIRSPEISEHLVKLYRDRGVDIIRGDEVREFRGRSRLDTVELHTGRELGAGLAVVGVGVQPAVSFLEGSGIAIDDGILVDERFRTNVPNVYAAGTSRASTTPSSDAGAASSTGRTRTTRAPRSARSSPARTAVTTPSPRSSPSRSDRRSRSSATSRSTTTASREGRSRTVTPSSSTSSTAGSSGRCRPARATRPKRS